jgi:transcriptional antiterminator NusG
MIQFGNITGRHDEPWLVIWTESRAEKKVAKRVATLGMSSWLPIVKERHRWSDRWRDIECPLFPGYLFARVAGASWHQILGTPGVLTIVKDGGTPALVAASLVNSLRDAIAREGTVPEAIAGGVDYAPGDEVIVQEGVLRGVRGIVREQRGGRQLVLWVAAIGRGISFTIGSALVKAARSE